MESVSIQRRLARVPGVGPAIVHSYRAAIAAKYLVGSFSDSSRRAVTWLVSSREYTNYTYPITSLSRSYMAAAVAVATGKSVSEVLIAFDEAESDQMLLEHIASAIAKSPDRVMTDRNVHFGRRLAWYAVVRLIKPNIVVETGVDKGLGSCLLAAALRRNHEGGSPGTYYGTDINPAAGYLLSGIYADYGKVLLGDSIATLQEFDMPIDVFINDSDHSSEYEAAEYRTVERKISPSAIVIGDNCERTDALLQFAQRTGRRFLFAREESERHIHPGTGVGIAFN
jgi:predicted O-methyltransferase YrrM